VSDCAADAGAVGVEGAAPWGKSVDRVLGGAEVGPAFCGAFSTVAGELEEVGVDEAFKGAAVRVGRGLCV
jgi:hypothetical protein